MKKTIRLLPLLFLLASPFLSAQNKFTLSGYVKDGNTGEDLLSARISVPAVKSGTMTNDYGYYSLTLPEGTYQVVYSYISYAPDTVTIVLDKDVKLDHVMADKSVQLEVVKIEAKAKDENVKSTDMSTNTLNVELVKKLPALMGEVDVIRTIDLLPGVQAVGEGITGYYVRGGQTNHNLIVLDEAPVYNASHILGFFSVFNSDALRDEYKLYKGGIPAQYGGRLASVLDLRMKEGNAKKFSGTGGIGLISSRLTLEAPIKKDKSSFMISGRRTYGDLFLLTSKKPDLRATRAYFYDVNAKFNYKFSDKDRIFLSGYFGRDVFKFRESFSNDWGNSTGTLRWNHLFSDKLFANTSLIFSDFKYGFELEFFGNDRFKYRSGIRDYNAKVDFDFFPNPKNALKFGANVIMHDFDPGVFEPVGDSSYLTPVKLNHDYAIESAVYISNEQTFTPRLTATYGVRYSWFESIGPGEEYTYSADGETILDTTQYSGFRKMNLYHGIEPRLAVRYILDENSSIKASYNRTRQYVHQASNSTASFPWDVWVPSSIHIPPQVADQVAFGYFRNFLKNNLETSIEVYYKPMKGQIDFRNGANLILNPTIEREILSGTGLAYGVEFFVKKKFGKLTGWVGYTLSKVTRQIDGINNDVVYAANNDRRHDLSVVGNLQLTKKLNVSAIWVYNTGSPLTMPVGKQEIEGKPVLVYGPRNNYRIPDYHRMDISVNLDPSPEKLATKKFHSNWNFAVYNAYGRRNTWAITIEDDDSPDAQDGQLVAKKLFLFRWVPSVTWNFHF
jgi:CarboxypepD_reg-like domain